MFFGTTGNCNVLCVWGVTAHLRQAGSNRIHRAAVERRAGRGECHWLPQAGFAQTALLIVDHVRVTESVGVSLVHLEQSVDLHVCEGRLMRISLTH